MNEHLLAYLLTYLKEYVYLLKNVELRKTTRKQPNTSCTGQSLHRARTGREGHRQHIWRVPREIGTANHATGRRSDCKHAVIVVLFFDRPSYRSCLCTLCRLSVCRLWRFVLWRNGTS